MNLTTWCFEDFKRAYLKGVVYGDDDESPSEAWRVLGFQSQRPKPDVSCSAPPRTNITFSCAAVLRHSDSGCRRCYGEQTDLWLWTLAVKCSFSLLSSDVLIRCQEWICSSQASWQRAFCLNKNKLLWSRLCHKHVCSTSTMWSGSLPRELPHSS